MKIRMLSNVKVYAGSERPLAPVWLLKGSVYDVLGQEDEGGITIDVCRPVSLRAGEWEPCDDRQLQQREWEWEDPAAAYDVIQSR